jgi:hypothetical protein
MGRLGRVAIQIWIIRLEEQVSRGVFARPPGLRHCGAVVEGNGPDRLGDAKVTLGLRRSFGCNPGCLRAGCLLTGCCERLAALCAFAQRSAANAKTSRKPIRLPYRPSPWPSGEAMEVRITKWVMNVKACSRRRCVGMRRQSWMRS